MGEGTDTRQSGFEEAMVTTDRGMFTLKEAAYLRSLPAVKEVSAARIIYSDSFKVECVRRYLKGESARKIFHDAGLDPALIGNKRVERCVARWKNTKYIVEEATETTIEETSDERPDTVRGGVSTLKACLRARTSPTRRSGPWAPAKPHVTCSTCVTSSSTSRRGRSHCCRTKSTNCSGGSTPSANPKMLRTAMVRTRL